MNDCAKPGCKNAANIMVVVSGNAHVMCPKHTRELFKLAAELRNES